MQLTETEARMHTAFERNLQQAIKLAAKHALPYSIYYDGKAITLLLSYATRPDNSLCVCIAERWDANTVQVRWNGARSDFITV